MLTSVQADGLFNPKVTKVIVELVEPGSQAQAAVTCPLPFVPKL